MITLELAQVSFLLDQLNMVMLAIEAPLVSNIVGWANYTASMTTFEATFVVWCSIHRYLIDRGESRI